MGGPGGSMGSGMHADMDTGTTQRDIARSAREADERASTTGQTHANANAGFDNTATATTSNGTATRDQKRSKRHSAKADDQARVHANTNAGLSTDQTNQTSATSATTAE